MNSKQRKTLSALKQDPLRTDIRYKDLMSLLLCLDFEFRYTKGSHVIIRHALIEDVIVLSRHNNNATIHPNTVKDLRTVLVKLKELNKNVSL